MSHMGTGCLECICTTAAAPYNDGVNARVRGILLSNQADRSRRTSRGGLSSRRPTNTGSRSKRLRSRGRPGRRRRWLGEGELEVVEFGQVGEELAIGLEGVEGDGHRRAPAVGAARRQEREGGREPLGPPPLERQPPKAPIWEVAAFFSTVASAEAS
jgi:hypothetical protein